MTMFLLRNITRCSPHEVVCTIERDRKKEQLRARFTRHKPEIHSVDFIDLPDERFRALANSDEFRAFVAVLFRYQNGEQVDLPQEIASDLLGLDAAQ